MSAIDSSWLVGEFVLAVNATVTINATDRTITTGRYYLRDATSALSLIAALQTEVAAVVGGSTVVIGQDRILRVISGGGALTLAIPASLRDVLGLVAAPAVGTTVAATSISTLLWSPGWPETTTGHPVWADGFDARDRVHTMSPTGLTSTVTTHHTQRKASWFWSAVPSDRCWSSSEAGGEFYRFFTDVLVPGYRFKLYSQVSEDVSSSTAVTWPTAFGPYVARELSDEWYSRFIPTTDSLGSNITLMASITSEIA